MKLKRLFLSMVVAGALVGCSTPQRIVLKDDTVIETRDEVDYNKKTGFYEYEDAAGNENKINSAEVLQIQEM
jgi:hypothetical protein